MAFSKVGVRDLIMLGLLAGSIYLAIADPSTRSRFADLAQVGLGGYLGQMIPRRGSEE
jgi:hypothetical protein